MFCLVHFLALLLQNPQKRVSHYQEVTNAKCIDDIWKLRLHPLPTSSLWMTVACSFMVAKGVRSIWVWLLAWLPKAAPLAPLYALGPPFRALPLSYCHLGQILGSKLGFLSNLETWHSHFSNTGKGRRGENHRLFFLFEPPLGLLRSPSLQFASSLSESLLLPLKASCSRWADFPPPPPATQCVVSLYRSRQPCQRQAIG